MMQVQINPNISTADLRATGNNSDQAQPDRSISFENQLSRALQSQPADKTTAPKPVCSASAMASLMDLGTVTSDQPTVSHLLIAHPKLGSKCWQIIHSEVNAEKPYTQIPQGTKIAFDPQSQEIVWKTDEPNNRADNTTQSSSSELPAFHKGQEQHNVEDRSRIEQSISRASAKYGLSQDLIRAVIRAESDFQPNAVSSAGAQGLMQLMPATARELGVNNPFDITENIDAGTRYLKKMLTLFNGDIKQALAAYNAGPQTIKKSQGEIPYHETRHYVQRVLSFSGLQA